MLGLSMHKTMRRPESTVAALRDAALPTVALAGSRYCGWCRHLGDRLTCTDLMSDQVAILFLAITVLVAGNGLAPLTSWL